ncbi:MAG: ABC transporter ATP-binding protein [Oscillochloris sp.]|nr:ABC transporter ATP-binding protein [Oscillochloris sp.]
MEVQDLVYRYPKATAPALHSLNFQVHQGEIFGFLGPSGAGKSTTQKILTGLLAGYQGHAVVQGRALDQWRSDDYERIGVGFELPNHFLRLTAGENLRYFAALYRTPARKPQELLELVGLRDSIDTPAEQLSKGMRARLNLARALLHNPPLLFLDEPTSGLDPGNAARIKNLIRAEQQAGRTIFLTTHNMAIAEELCDRVAFLVDGAIVAIDTPQALKLRYGTPTVRVTYRNGRGPEERSFALDALAEDAVFQGLLRSGTIQTIHTQEASLEQIFLQVTGRSLQCND